MRRIAITDPGRTDAEYERYATWVQHWIPDVTLLRLSSAGAATTDLASCGGLMLTGGGDVHPRYYGMPEALELMKGMDEKRDEFEFRLIDDALRLRLPVLGICRGSQVFNVATGGTLIPDIERTGRPSHRRDGERDRIHGIVMERNSSLRTIVGRDDGEVNSSHHQAVDTPGKGLVISARSADGVAEALEWGNGSGMSFLLLVQWHPERMADRKSPFSRGIIQRFALEVGGSERRQ